MEHFLSFLDKTETKIIHVKESHIKRFIISLKDQGVSNHTIARKNSALRWYFKFLRKSGMMVENPMEDIKQPELEKRKTAISDEEIDQLETFIRLGGKTRDLAIFYLLWYEKIKLSEIVQIKKEDFNIKQSILYLHNKAILISDKTHDLLKEECEKTENGYLFKNERNKPLTESGAYFILKTFLRQVERPDIRPIDLSK